MTLAFVRHGAKRRQDDNPELTSLGHRMAYSAGIWLKKHVHKSPVLISTPTIRTVQSAKNIKLALEESMDIIEQNIPSDWNSFQRYVIDIFNTYQNNYIILVGHHPTMEMLITKFSLPIPRHHFSSGVLLEKDSLSWKCAHYWIGQADL